MMMLANPARVIPEPKENNRWYTYSGSDTVLIFLHGIFSDSRGCWLYSEPSRRAGLRVRKSAERPREIYWPDLIADDPKFAGVDIFLAGFHTAVDARDYDLGQCAYEVYSNLRVPLAPADKPLMARKNLIFIGHSTGGIVARYLLERNQKAFQQKNVGLVLIASPSTGSFYADLFSFLADIYRNELGGILRRDSVLLADLDSRFKEMVHNKEEHIPRLVGAEACEHHMILRRKLFGRLHRWVPPLTKRRVVDPKSAGQYFPPVEMIADSDHFSVVKPPSARHYTHTFLGRFWYQFQTELAKELLAGGRSAPVLAPPAPSDPPIGREQLLKHLKQRLLNGESCGLHGTAGSGKTLVVQSLVHDKELREAFGDGILWWSFSPDKDASALFAAWSDALGITGAAVAQLRRVDDRARAVANEVGERKMLIVCENCEAEDTAILVRLVGTNCARIVTSLSRRVAETFSSPSGAVEIPPLAPADAAMLLAHVAPALSDKPEIISKLISVLGCQPKDVVVLGRMLAGISDGAKRDDIIGRLIGDKA